MSFTKSLIGKKLLVVEDDEMLREMLVELFTDLKGEVLHAANGTDAFKIVQENNIDVVLTDVRMPGGDGIELAKNIHLMPGKKPVVFICSGFHDMSDEMIVEYNIAKVFSKPFDRKELTKAVIESVSK